jgi:hypothetical protein
MLNRPVTSKDDATDDWYLEENDRFNCSLDFKLPIKYNLSMCLWAKQFLF